MPEYKKSIKSLQQIFNMGREINVTFMPFSFFGDLLKILEQMAVKIDELEIKSGKM